MIEHCSLKNGSVGYVMCLLELDFRVGVVVNECKIN
jgi:hypothetical protein